MKNFITFELTDVDFQEPFYRAVIALTAANRDYEEDAAPTLHDAVATITSAIASVQCRNWDAASSSAADPKPVDHFLDYLKRTTKVTVSKKVVEACQDVVYVYNPYTRSTSFI